MSADGGNPSGLLRRMTGVRKINASLAAVAVRYDAWFSRHHGHIILGLLALVLFSFWAGFVTEHHRTDTLTWASYGMVAFLFVLSIGLLIAGVVTASNRILLLVGLATTFVLLLAVFSILYWQMGTTKNFSKPLSHLDAIYFAFGTLSTAGTGNINAVSDKARALQMLQEFLDLFLVLIVLVGVVARFVRTDRPDGEPAPSTRSVPPSASQ